MRRPVFALALVAVALGAAACSTASAPGWTYAPPTAAPSASAGASGGPSASAGASEAPSAGASAGASASAPASAAPSASAGASASAPAAQAVQISAMGIAFEQTDVTAPADTAFTIDFDNKEAVPHNVEIKDGSGAAVFTGDIVTGPTQVQYQVGPLAAGAYTFHCTVHPNMTGNLTVGS